MNVIAVAVALVVVGSANVATASTKSDNA